MTVAYLAGQKINCLSTDTKPTTNLNSGWVAEETDTFDRYYWDGLDWYLMPAGSLSSKKYARWDGDPSATIFGYGSVSSAGTLNRSSDVNGHYTNAVTTATNPAQAGLRFPALTELDLNPYIKFRFRTNSLTHSRLWIGLASLTSIATGADPWAATQSAIMLHVPDGAPATNFQVVTNNASANSNFSNIATADTSIHTIEFRGLSASSKWQYRFDSGTWTDVTVQIPASTTDLSIHMSCETVEAVSKSADFFRYIIISDK